MGIVAMALIACTYFAGWHWRAQIGLANPTANLRYFYYGAGQCTYSDSFLYWLYRPMYSQHLAQQGQLGGRNDVHWSDREGGKGYEHLCKHGRILGV